MYRSAFILALLCSPAQADYSHHWQAMQLRHVPYADNQPFGHLRDKQPWHQLNEINQFVNQVRFRPDDRNYGELDYWAAPHEFFQRGGDCEDYAIAKYLFLQSLGHQELRILIVWDTNRQVPHAVLEATKQRLILDNLNPKIIPLPSHYEIRQEVSE